jgi:hypothetical protein
MDDLPDGFVDIFSPSHKRRQRIVAADPDCSFSTKGAVSGASSRGR